MSEAMKYTIRENKDRTHTLLRYGEPAANPIPNNAELEFWFRIEELEKELAEAKEKLASMSNDTRVSSINVELTPASAEEVERLCKSLNLDK